MISILQTLFKSSLGRKYIMGLTGLGTIGFLFAHLGGNLVLFLGPDEFNAYARHLHSMPLLPVFEAALFVLFAVHIAMGVVLTVQNWQARPVGYACRRRITLSTMSSSTMIYSGIVILAFMIFHIWTMKLSHSGAATHSMVTDMLSRPVMAVLYATGTLAVGFHLIHGVSSTFQTFGMEHRRVHGLISFAGRVCALIIAAGFVSIPVFISLILSGGTGR